MPALKYLTWNVRGIRAKPKRNVVMAYLKAQCTNIMVLVETHLTAQLNFVPKKTLGGIDIPSPLFGTFQGHCVPSGQISTIFYAVAEI